MAHVRRIVAFHPRRAPGSPPPGPSETGGWPSASGLAVVRRRWLDAGRNGGSDVQLFGPLMVILFCLSQAFRDVYLGHVFQRVDFFAVVLLAFAPSTLFFAALSFWRTPADWRRLAIQGRTILAMNVTTALAWTSYFFALTHLEPAAVNTLHSGVGPFTVIVLGWAGVALAGKVDMGRAEAMCQAGAALTLVGLAVVVVAGWSGLGRPDAAGLAALGLLVVSGASITISHLYSRRMAEAGFGADTITAVRYFFIMIGATIALVGLGRPTGVTGAFDAATLGLAAAVLIALPLYILQVGVARTPQLTAHVIRALGPVFVFALQQLDGRLSMSLPVLALIILYSFFVIAANVLRGWKA